MNKPAVGWPDTDHPRTPSGWAWAPNLLPPVAPAAWPRGIQRNASEAESILSEAVAWWDPTISGFRDGDRWLRNSGTAGGLLDLRLGSSTVANTNDPTWLGPEDRGYVYLPGVAGNYLSVPDENALDITGDLDVRVRVSLADWTPGAQQFLAAKYVTTGNQRSWQFGVNTNGTLDFIWSTDGSATIQATSTSTPNVADGTSLWVRVALDVNDGGVYKVYFYTSTDGAVWGQLGSTITGGTTTSIYSSTAAVEVGSRVGGTLGAAAGSFYRAQVLNGIDGTTVLDVDCDAITSGSATSFTAVTGQTVTINRSTSGRKSVAVPARRLGGRSCFLFGTDDYMEVVDNWQHQLLNFPQAQSFTLLAVVRTWANQVDGLQIITKRNPATDNVGWRLDTANNNTTTAEYRSILRDGPAPDGVSLFGSSTAAFGSVAVIGISVDRGAALGTFFALTTGGTVPAPNVNIRTLKGVSNAVPVTVGRATGSTPQYMHFEFRAAAIWRRPLTAREIAVLSTYYSGG